MNDVASLNARDVLKMRDFRLLWLGQIVSNFGDSLTSLSLLILINHLTGSTAALATMTIVLAIPQVTFGLLAGVYVDRWDRKRVMIISDVLRGIIVLGFIFAAQTEQIGWLYVLGFIQAAIGTFFNPARMAVIPNVVPASGLLAANSLGQLSQIVFNLLGTAAAGVIIGATGLFWPAFTIDALTFFISALLISRVIVASRQTTQQAGNPRAILRQLFDGIRLIFRNRILVGVLTAAAVAMLGLGAVNVLFVPLLVNDLKVPETWFGAVELAQVSSMVLSAGIVALLASRFEPTRIISLGMLMLGVLIGLVYFAQSIWAIIAILFAVGWIMTPLQASIATLIQTLVPDEVRGRIGASLSTLISTANLLSMAFAGVFGDAIGIREVFVLSGIITMLAGIASAWVFKGTTAIAERQPEAAIAVSS